MNKREQFRIDSLEELKEAYKHFEDEWDEGFSLESEMKYFMRFGYRFITYKSSGINLFKEAGCFKQIPNPLKQMKEFTISGSPALKKAFCEEIGVDLLQENSHESGDLLRINSQMALSTNVSYDPNFNLPEQWRKAIAFASKKTDEPKFEKGKWYKSEHGFGLCCYQGDNEVDSTSFEGYGFYDVHGWVSKNTDPEAYESWSKSAGWELATDKEVKQALIKEAKKRGFKKGVMFDPVYQNGMPYKSIYNLFNEDFEYGISGEDSLSIMMNEGWIRVYSNGKWAEIEETYSIGDVFKDKTNSDTYILSEVDEDRVQLTCLEDGEAYLYGAGVSNRWKITTDEMEEITGGDFDDFEKMPTKIK